MQIKSRWGLKIIVFVTVILAVLIVIVSLSRGIWSAKQITIKEPVTEGQSAINELQVDEITVNVLPDEGQVKSITAESVTYPVYTYGMQSEQTIDCKIIDSIVYVSVQDYLILPGSTDMNSQNNMQTENDKWILTSSGKSFTFDTGKNQISLKIIPELYSALGEQLSPFLEKTSMETTSSEQSNTAYTISLDEYGMMIYEQDGKVYLPFPLASIILSDGMDAFYMFSKDGIYLTDLYADLEDSNSAYPGNYCGNAELTKNIFQTSRTKEEAAFSYGLICLNIDYFYGLPGVSLIESDPYNIQTRGLDKALDMTDFGKTAKEYLLSQSWAEYVCGLEMLNLLFFDGHCMIPYSNPTYYWDQNEMRMVSALSEHDTAELKDLENWLSSTEEYSCLLKKREDRSQLSRGIWKTREELWGMSSGISYGEDTYHEQGDTAFISFDNFMIDHEAWDEYYANECQGEVPNSDCIGTVYYGLKKASENPEIQHVVIDLTDNLGGEADAVSMILAQVTGKAYFRTEDTQTGVITRVNYKADCNFDGIFDDRDQSRYDFKFSILVSGNTFSAGSALALYGSDEGVFIVGTPVKGGCCAERFYVDGMGILYCLSSHIRVVNSEGVTSDQMDESFVDQLLDIPDSLVDYYGSAAKECEIFYDTSIWY